MVPPRELHELVRVANFCMDSNSNKKTAIAALNGTPKGIRIPVYTVKGCCPRPLDDGGIRLFSIIIHKQTDNVI